MEELDQINILVQIKAGSQIAISLTLHNMGLCVKVSVTSRTQPHILRVAPVRFEVHLDM